ncbi:hypothetical protein [Azoarcus sp. KH32C]|uniref:hypothetical protein n=1 Tax=Azoarcus sp. KH32C TaxID=748247 RepID=UPI00023869E5|nr:hypothetical protein [Azoarcus sp. KH32C]BAL22687.1 hypothetical protein AZKH_0341 [Azoarcus sp. KH32C]
MTAKLRGQSKTVTYVIRASQAFLRESLAAMKRSARGAGSLLRAVGCAGITGVVLTAFFDVQAQEATSIVAESNAIDLLMPREIIIGGFSAPPSTVPGAPPGGQFVKFLFPSALAANGPDIYLADAGQRLLLRIDGVTRSVTRLRELPGSPGTRLKTGPDGSVYVVSPGRREVERIARDGRRLAVFGAKFEILQPADVVVEQTLNRVWIADAAGGVFAFHPSGRLSEPLAGRGDGFADENSGATVLSAGRERVAGIDPRCRCIVEFSQSGVAIGRYGEGQLTYPVDLAIDLHGRTWVLDRADHRLKVFANGNLIASISTAQLGLTDITALAFDGHLAYIADGPGGRVGVFTILQPRR